MQSCRLYMIGIAFIIAGLYFIFCAIIKRGWLTNLSSAKLFVQIFGQAGARICSIILGFLLILFGIAFINYCLQLAV